MQISSLGSYAGHDHVHLGSKRSEVLGIRILRWFYGRKSLSFFMPQRWRIVAFRAMGSALLFCIAWKR